MPCEQQRTLRLLTQLVAHACADPAGDFVTFYGKNFTAEDMAAAVSEHVKRWNAGPTKAV